MTSPLARHWTLDPAVDYLNHGSFGACPAAVLDEQARLREELEREPVDFLVRRLPARLDAVRASLAEFVGADPEGLVPVANATTGVNAVLRSAGLGPGDEVLVTDHAYGACRNAVEEVARGCGAAVVVARIPFPVSGPGEVVARVLGRATARTRLALIDHVTSPTGLVFPVADLVGALESRGIDCLVDGAHAPGMLPIDIRSLRCAYYAGNAHKWICAPKGAGFLWVREDRRERVRPTVISHGAGTVPRGRSRLHTEFDWVGTADPTPFLAIPAALSFLGGLLDGGWEEIRETNRRLAKAARERLCEALGIPSPAPDSMLGSLASVPLPSLAAPIPAGELDPLQETLRERHRIEVPVMIWSQTGDRLIRVSAQVYNDMGQYDRLSKVLVAELTAGRDPNPGVAAENPRPRGNY